MNVAVRQILLTILLFSLSVPVTAGPLEDAELAYNRGDYATAVKQFRPLAEAGNPIAQRYLGISYAEERGVPQDLGQAYMWLNLSVAQGFSQAKALRDFLASSLTPAQLAEAEKLARDQKPIDMSEDFSSRITLPGFSILPPVDRNWSRSLQPRQDISVTFSRSNHAGQGLDRLHTFVLMATTEFFDLPYEEVQKLRDALEEKLRAKFKPELLKSFEISSDRHEECIQYRIVSLDEDRLSTRKGGFFNLEIHGRYCLHPYHPTYVIGISYSQRSRSGEWDNSFDGEADRFLNSLAFKPIQFGGYVAKKFDAYASALSRIGRTTEASTIKQYSQRLSSSYWGFSPAKVLEEYAEFLRNENDEVGSDRMKVLSSRVQANNVAGYLYQLHRAAETAGQKTQKTN